MIATEIANEALRNDVVDQRITEFDVLGGKFELKEHFKNLIIEWGPEYQEVNITKEQKRVITNTVIAAVKNSSGRYVSLYSICITCVFIIF